MNKTSILLLTLAVVCLSCPHADKKRLNQITEFAEGLLEGSGLQADTAYLGECVTGIFELKNNKFLAGENVSEEELMTIANEAFELVQACKSAFEDTFKVLALELTQAFENRDLYLTHLFENRATILNNLATAFNSVERESYYKSGYKFGKTLAQILGADNEEIEAIRAANQEKILAGTYGPNTTDIPLALQNVTLFVEGFGNGFNIQGTVTDLLNCELGLLHVANDTLALVHSLKHFNPLNVLAGLSQWWGDFTNALDSCNAGVGQALWEFHPALLLAESNFTYFEGNFSANLKAAPIKSGWLLLSFKTAYANGLWYTAGNDWGELSQIGLKGLDNVTASDQ